MSLAGLRASASCLRSRFPLADVSGGGAWAPGGGDRLPLGAKQKTLLKFKRKTGFHLAPKMYFPADNGLLSAPPRAGRGRAGETVRAAPPLQPSRHPSTPDRGRRVRAQAGGRPALQITRREQTRPEPHRRGQTCLAGRAGLGSPRRPPLPPCAWASQMRPPHSKGLLRSAARR